MGIAFVYCFFLMEETNYDRRFTTNTSVEFGLDTATDCIEDQPEPKTNTASEKDIAVDTAVVEASAGQTLYTRKTYWQKLSIVDKKRPNRLLDIMIAPFKFFTMPVVVWAGLMYGGNGLVWSGIINATSSTIYTDVYNFTSLDIGYAYFACVIGMLVG